MDDYLTKPTELATLREKLARWLESDAGVRSAPPEGVIDRARIQELVGTPAGVAEVLAGVEASARRDIVSLQSAIETKNGAVVRAAAHRIKGSALNLGARRLAAAAVRVERAPDALESPEMVAGVRRLIEELKVVLADAA
jgi:HPt (histidine-containing phosphotransfer) domain-containing protein